MKRIMSWIYLITTLILIYLILISVFYYQIVMNNFLVNEFLVIVNLCNSCLISVFIMFGAIEYFICSKIDERLDFLMGIETRDMDPTIIVEIFNLIEYQEITINNINYKSWRDYETTKNSLNIKKFKEIIRKKEKEFKEKGD